VPGGFRDFSILTEMTDEEVTMEPIQEALDAFLVEVLGYLRVDRRRLFGPRERPGLHERRARRVGPAGS